MYLKVRVIHMYLVKYIYIMQERETGMERQRHFLPAPSLEMATMTKAEPI